MVNSMPLAIMASMTSPEQGAQHECNSTFLCPLGGVKIGRSIGVRCGLSLAGAMVAFGVCLFTLFMANQKLKLMDKWSLLYHSLKKFDKICSNLCFIKENL